VLSYCGVPEMQGSLPVGWRPRPLPVPARAVPAAARPPAASASTYEGRELPGFPSPLLEIGVMPSVLSANLPDARGSEQVPGRIGQT